MVGIGRGARDGVLIKDAEGLELMEKVDTLIVDKTGTLTEGKPKVQQIIANEGFARADVLVLAAALENLSEHPLATAIIEHIKTQSLPILAVSDFKAITGKGIQAVLDGQPVRLGNSLMFKEAGINTSSLNDKANELQNQGQTVMFVAVGERCAGLISVADSIKPESREAIRLLHAEGVKIIMTSGCFWASLINCDAAASNFVKLLLPSVSMSLIEKPPDKPRPGIAGGRSTKDLTSCTCFNPSFIAI
jgi:P-type E1-E2 ATPase